MNAKQKQAKERWVRSEEPEWIREDLKPSKKAPIYHVGVTTEPIQWVTIDDIREVKELVTRMGIETFLRVVEFVG